MEVTPELVELLRRLIREELRQAPELRKPVAVVTPPPTPLDLKGWAVPKWLPAYAGFKGRVPGEFDMRAMAWLRQHQHAHLWLPDPRHNPLVNRPVDLRSNLGSGFWSPSSGLETLMPLGEYDDLARCFAKGCRKTLSTLGQRFVASGGLQQGLVGDALPPLPHAALSTLEWTFIPRAMVLPLRSSLELSLRPLDGVARPPLPRWFEPVHPYSVVVAFSPEWCFLFGPRAPALGRPVLCGSVE